MIMITTSASNFFMLFKFSSANITNLVELKKYFNKKFSRVYGVGALNRDTIYWALAWSPKKTGTAAGFLS